MEVPEFFDQAELRKREDPLTNVVVAKAIQTPYYLTQVEASPVGTARLRLEHPLSRKEVLLQRHALAIAKDQLSEEGQRKGPTARGLLHPQTAEEYIRGAF